MCSRRVQFATFGARCSSAPHRLSLSALAIRLRIETTSHAIHMSELPVIQPCVIAAALPTHGNTQSKSAHRGGERICKSNPLVPN